MRRQPADEHRCYDAGAMRLRALLVIGTALLPACGSDSEERSAPSADAGADVVDDAAVDTADAAGDAVDDKGPVEEAGTDAQGDAPVEAGPTSCATPCEQACETTGAMEGECAACVDAVCAEYRSRAEQAPGRDAFFTCLSGCGSDAACPNECCDQHAVACAWEVAYQMCTCGFPEDSCVQSCAEFDCSTSGLTQACGVCASQSPCSLETFDYLFAPERLSHQDCLATCTSSAMAHEQCLDLCRGDYPEAGTAYDAYLSCVCEG